MKATSTPPTPSLSALTVAVVLALAATGCGETTDTGDAPDAGGPSGGASAVITDGDYTSTDVTGHDLVPDTVVRLGWADGQLRLQAGCNTMSGPASVEDGRLRVQNLAGTEMGCPPELMAQDTWLVDLVSGGPEVTAEPEGFTLTGEVAEIRFATEQPPPDSDLTGTTWELETTVEGEVASGSADPDTPVAGPGGPRRPQLRITGARLQAFDGCNELFGPVEVGPDSIRAPGLAGTKRACTDPGATRTARLLGQLLQESSYAVEGPRLTLRRDDVALVFRATD